MKIIASIVTLLFAWFCNPNMDKPIRILSDAEAATIKGADECYGECSTSLAASDCQHGQQNLITSFTCVRSTTEEQVEQGFGPCKISRSPIAATQRFNFDTTSKKCDMTKKGAPSSRCQDKPSVCGKIQTYRKCVFNTETGDCEATWDNTDIKANKCN